MSSRTGKEKMSGPKDQKKEQNKEKDAPKKRVADLSLEEGMEELSKIVTLLERGLDPAPGKDRMPLDKSVDLYARATVLREHCETKLQEAKMRVEKMSKKEGSTTAEPVS